MTTSNYYNLLMEELSDSNLLRKQDTFCHWDGDILRIIPSNNAARLAFHHLVESQLNKTLGEHHSRFIVATGKRPLEESNARHPRPHDETTSDESEAEIKCNQEVHQGYFRISFRHPRVRDDLVFNMGRGSGKLYGPTRDVDILLAASDQKSNIFRRGLKAAHAFIKIHQDSGVWLLQAGEDSPPLALLKSPQENVPSPSPATIPSNDRIIATLNDEPLTRKQYRPLCRPHNTLQINQMYYYVDYALEKLEHERPYLEERDTALKMSMTRIPPIAMSGIPFEIDTVTKTAVFRAGLGIGSFGRVFEGCDRVTGDLRAVKQIPVNKIEHKDAVQKEIRALQLFGGSEGIVTLHEVSNSLGATEPTDGKPPFDVYLVQERGVAFSRYNWAAEDPIDWRQRAVLARQLVQGLVSIHKQGCMHRDITPMNILYFAQPPSHAGFCDFGKVCYSRSSTETALADFYFLPPEIQKSQSNTYDQKVDIWMLGLSLIMTWFPQAIRGLKPRNEAEHISIRGRLRSESDSGLIEVLLRMFAWYTVSRPTAEEVLNDPCLVNVSHAQPEAKSSGRKRIQAADEI